jgi:hypothetical protein
MAEVVIQGKVVKRSSHNQACMFEIEGASEIDGNPHHVKSSLPDLRF